SGLSGFALMEALIALLLLATAMIGAGTAMVHSLAGQRAALLRTQAVDLAADLAEALRAAPDAAAQEAEISAWQAAVLRRLPQAQSDALRRPPPQTGATSLSPGFDIHLQWRDGRAPSPSVLALPVAVGSSLERS
ncbi:MAG: hypothetical protein ABI645_17500, partial [Pseudomonadota bacterium]